MAAMTALENACVDDSVARAIDAAPLDKRADLFRVVARESAHDAAGFRQVKLDELWNLAASISLPQSIGTAKLHQILTAEFVGHDSAFAAACREADRQQRPKRRQEAQQPRLAESTKQAIEFLLHINDADRLNWFIAEHPRTEARLILAYVKERRS
jgi:hypothetical protein